MAGSRGSFAFLPLSNKSVMKAPIQQKTVGNSKSKMAPGSRSGSGADIQKNDQEDEWYDTASSEGVTPVKKKTSIDVVKSVDKLKSMSLSDVEEEKLLPYMPTLFSTDLPPCGPEVQVAYEMLNARLRAHWLKQRGRVNVIDTCQAIKDELRNQNYLWPPFSVKGKFKRRKPWCRENIFKYQLQWIEYFVREAQAQDTELMTEAEIMDRKKHSSEPPELKFHLGDRHVVKMWDEWNEKKRAKAPLMPNTEMDTGLLKGLSDGAKDSDGQKKEILSEETVVHDLNGDGAEDDSHYWAQRDHD